MNTKFLKKACKVNILFGEEVPVMMDKESNDYVKVCFKKAELIYKRFYHIVFLEICKYFNLMRKGLKANKILRGRGA